MKYEELYPSSPLNKYIQCIWQLKGNRAEAAEYGKQILIPNDSVEVVFNFADSFPDTLQRPISDPYTAYVVGPITKTNSTYFLGDIELLGITFRPGMAFPFIQNNMSDIRDSIIPLSLLWKDLALQYDELKHASLQNKLTIIEKECYKKIDELSRKHLERIEYCFSYLNKNLKKEDIASVSDLVQISGYSERSLERIFPVFAGMTPKEYLRIKRINNIAKTILVDKADIYQAIVMNGLVDYSHLKKELKYFGYTDLTSKPFTHSDFISSYLAS